MWCNVWPYRYLRGISKLIGGLLGEVCSDWCLTGGWRVAASSGACVLCSGLSSWQAWCVCRSSKSLSVHLLQQFLSGREQLFPRPTLSFLWMCPKWLHIPYVVYYFRSVHCYIGNMVPWFIQLQATIDSISHHMLSQGSKDHYWIQSRVKSGEFYPFCKVGVHHEVVDMFLCPSQLQFPGNHSNHQHCATSPLCMCVCAHVCEREINKG